MSDLMRLLTEIIGLSPEAATPLIAEFGELAAQTHAMVPAQRGAVSDY